MLIAARLWFARGPAQFARLVVPAGSLQPVWIDIQWQFSTSSARYQLKSTCHGNSLARVDMMSFSYPGNKDESKSQVPDDRLRLKVRSYKHSRAQTPLFQDARKCRDNLSHRCSDILT
jgi:hypothetical protein